MQMKREKRHRSVWEKTGWRKIEREKDTRGVRQRERRRLGKKNSA